MPIFDLSAPGSVEHRGMVIDCFERNGYDDSDFIAVVWTGTEAVEILYASTRFHSTASAVKDASFSVIQAYQDWLNLHAEARAAAKKAARMASPEPNDLAVGVKVAWLRDSKFQVRAEAPCEKCKGEGCWINPRNPSDRRPCFGCEGQGIVQGSKQVGEDGKPIWNKVPRGTVGEVLDWSSFGNFYRNGYNVTSRKNTSVKVRLEDGRRVSVTLDALRLV